MRVVRTGNDLLCDPCRWFTANVPGLTGHGFRPQASY